VCVRVCVCVFVYVCMCMYVYVCMYALSHTNAALIRPQC